MPDETSKCDQDKQPTIVRRFENSEQKNTASSHRQSVLSKRISDTADVPQKEAGAKQTKQSKKRKKEKGVVTTMARPTHSKHRQPPPKREALLVKSIQP